MSVSIRLNIWSLFVVLFALILFAKICAVSNYLLFVIYLCIWPTNGIRDGMGEEVWCTQEAVAVLWGGVEDRWIAHSRVFFF